MDDGPCLATAPHEGSRFAFRADKPIVVVTPESLDKVKDAAVEAAARPALDCRGRALRIGSRRVS